MGVALSVAAIVLGLVTIVFGAYNVAMMRQMQARVTDLEAAVAALSGETEEETEQEEPEEEEEEGNPEDDVPVDPAPPEKEGPPPPVWAEFLEAYNKFAQNVGSTGDASGAPGFVKDKGLTLLTCKGHITDDAGKNLPDYGAETEVEASLYWAFQIPGRPLDYVVVPNPAHPYDENMHNENGMKETFASNFESGTMKNIFVKNPALFHKKGEEWEIAQPGVLELS